MSQSSVDGHTTPRPESDVSSGASSHQAQHNEKVSQLDISLDEVVEAVSDLVEAKKLQFGAQWALVGAEAKLLKQSVLVTVLATLATFAFGCVCWLILNIASAVLLTKAELHAALVAGILLLINGSLMFMTWRVARQAFQFISINPLVATFKGEPEDSQTREQRNEPES
ncbi:hypothetical protein KUL42_17490 [Alteromonas sp. KUL42]|uniref:hypothetical protein n=1 Tax=Alteromonas sp. KUL42 TaxID=2480797 RepID=UPI0010365C64|nr:hypothetical protein [Alteromonas sp. KUL42]TAP36764.1 hypothetical protein EYR97_08630 [Alteromonas sp. KUL42]GEA06988.1 hypothetical protein KUL42_17490 [Alteromonas sp. KUL42]